EFADECIKGFSTTLLLNSQKKTLKLSAKTDSAQPDSGATLMLEPVGGAVVLESPFYLLRPTDADFQAAITRRDSIVLVKGARQMGKTSLLARGLQQARSLGAKVVLTDFQMLSEEHFRSSDSLFLALAQTYADQFDLPTLPNDVWKSQRGPTINLQRYIQKEVLGQLSQPIVWGLDEVDRLLAYPYASEFFGLLRSWHNARALEPSGSWHKLTIAIAYATEAHLLIADPNQSPFNVGTQILLKDFTLEEVAELNRRHKYPLKSHAEVERLFSLLGGQPYLVRCALYEMVNRKMSIDELEETGSNSIFADHLQRILQIIRRDKTIAASVLTIVEGGRCNDEAAFYRLRSAGIMSGNSASTMKPRCQLYENFLRVNLRDS
ncbi:MAG: AAA-like domain-containing protein, partial [Blastocatellia bacterium]|nr:AAA-like domain-containing protein [Blastocatellia bacterium]